MKSTDNLLRVALEMSQVEFITLKGNIGGKPKRRNQGLIIEKMKNCALKISQLVQIVVSPFTK